MKALLSAFQPQAHVGRRRAFASITAIVLLGLFGATLAAMLAMIANDYRRTVRESSQSQMRQMFLAATAQVVQDAAQWGNRPVAGKITVALPDALRAMEASIESQANTGSNNTAEVEMTAHIGKDSARQSIHLAHSSNGWIVENVKLIQ